VSEKQTADTNPGHEQKSSAKKAKVGRTTNKVVASSADKMRPKRACRQLVNYNESIESVDQSLIFEESGDELSKDRRQQEEAATVHGKRTTRRRRSDKVAQMTHKTTPTAVRCVLSFVAYQMIIIACCIVASCRLLAGKKMEKNKVGNSYIW